MALSIGELVGYVDLDAGPAEAAGDKIGGLFESMGGKWTGILGGAGIAAGGAVAAGLFSAMDTEAATDKLAAGLGKGSKAAEMYGDLAGRVYSNGFGTGVEDVSTAIGAVVSSIKGMRHASDKEVQSMTEKAMTFADVMGIDVTKAASTAGNMVNVGLAKNGAQAFDLLMKASQKVPVQLREDVLDATDEYGQFFNQLGIGGPQAMGMLAEGAKKGMYGIDKAGDAIKEFTIRATDGSDLTQTAMKGIGLNADTMANAILAGGNKAKGATDKIVKGLLSIKDPQERANASIALFGTPLEDLSTKDIPVFLRSLRDGEKSLGRFKGSVDKAGTTAYDNASSNFSMFGRTLKTHFVELIGGSVLPKVTELSSALVSNLGPAFKIVGDAIAASTKFLSDHSTTAQVLAGIIAALTVVTLAHSAVMAVAAAGGMAAWLSGTKAISLATKVWAAVQWALNAAMSANPIGLVIAAIALLAVGLVVAYKKSQTFRNIVNAAFSGVAKAAKKVFGWLSKAVTSTIGFVRDHWKLIVGILGGPFVAAVMVVVSNWSRIKAAVSKGVSAVKGALGALAAIPGMIGGWLSRARDAAAEKLGAMVDVAKSIPSRIRGALGSLGHLLYDAGASVISGLISGITSKISAVTDKLHSITKLIPLHKGPPSKDRKLLLDAGIKIMEGLINGLESMEGKLKDKLEAITSRVASTKDSMAALAGQIADNFRTDAFSGDLAGFDSILSVDTANAKAFGKAMRTAVKSGLSGGLMTSLAESGNLALAQQFAGMSSVDIASRERAFKGRNSAALNPGNFTSRNVFGDRLRQQVDELRGIRKDLAKVTDKLGGRRHQLHVLQQRGESAEELAERLWHMTRKRG